MTPQIRHCFGPICSPFIIIIGEREWGIVVKLVGKGTTTTTDDVWFSILMVAQLGFVWVSTLTTECEGVYSSDIPQYYYQYEGNLKDLSRIRVTPQNFKISTRTHMLRQVQLHASHSCTQLTMRAYILFYADQYCSKSHVVEYDMTHGSPMMPVCGWIHLLSVRQLRAGKEE